MALARLSLILIVVLSVVYLCLYFYLRSGAVMRLEEDWAREGRDGDRDAYIDERIAAKAARIRVWLVVLVYVLPLAGLIGFISLTN